ncbi:Sodium:sulfate symporter transmembrane region family protein [Trichomonas vaginalis G3]|uniref:Sodium:sulfate symporter transmembrane region family protein n=1 Tax=Trichomonas vaginalis (strain ATCC PRA-98 / G3) TaxID=412133 RepID=A2EIU4_TRIV3|nr:low-affinity phosphate transporter PHO91 family [Trichomonas vaginalis G3]EAY07428.1 Sodium:sulfate symporter transmembrane region family protein [Trichomonas vaginalis G3]KAI5484637.1 low-affinity phosphate transporter PHO91 family [Trichomonas vaginalis G3]|eukprot:XP_001319651.1 Sodium:sulfate symporter transmembrane region family protein [Trichomonas vaginalis G3]
MKFGKQIRFVAVKAWYDKYVDYKKLKKVIAQGRENLFEAHDNGALMAEVETMKETFLQEFFKKLYKDLNVVTSFYSNEYVECQKLIDEINIDIKEHVEFSNRDEDTQKSFLKRVFGITLEVYELRTFLEVNRTAGQKIVKKIKKNFGNSHWAEDFIINEADIFLNLPEIRNLINELEDQYITVVREISLTPDTRPRPEIILELHNKVDATMAWKQSTILRDFNAIDFRKSELSAVSQPVKLIPLIIAFVFLIVFSVAQFTSKLKYSAQKCIGVIGFCAILWATGAVPLWLTSLSIPLLAVVLKVITGYTPADLGKLIQSATMSPTVFLTMGGFTIAAALRATEMDKRIASLALKKAASNARIFLLVCSLLNAFIAMWISNITSTMIVVTLVGPTLRQIPRDSNYARAVVLSIALGGNLGGMMTPLSSPQNAVTVQAVADASKAFNIKASVSFTEFFATALPFSIICALIAWVIIMFKYPIDIQGVPPIPESKTDFGWRQIFVSVVSVAIIIVWICLPFGAEKVFSDYGIVGFLPMIIFYGVGILPPSKIAELPWNIIFLLMGGNVLSKIVQTSGLMDVISNAMTDLLGNQTLWVTILIVNICVIVIDFFLTHTVSSMITMPLVANFAGKRGGHIALFCMCGCMATTASQILPVSSFPNMCCVSLTDDTKKEYISSGSFIRWGIMITAVLFACVMTVYYGIGIAYGM